MGFRGTKHHFHGFQAAPCVSMELCARAQKFAPAHSNASVCAACRPCAPFAWYLWCLQSLQSMQMNGSSVGGYHTIDVCRDIASSFLSLCVTTHSLMQRWTRRPLCEPVLGTAKSGAHAPPKKRTCQWHCSGIWRILDTFFGGAPWDLIAQRGSVLLFAGVYFPGCPRPRWGRCWSRWWGWCRAADSRFGVRVLWCWVLPRAPYGFAICQRRYRFRCRPPRFPARFRRSSSVCQKAIVVL